MESERKKVKARKAEEEDGAPLVRIIMGDTDQHRPLDRPGVLIGGIDFISFAGCSMVLLPNLMPSPPPSPKSDAVITSLLPSHYPQGPTTSSQRHLHTTIFLFINADGCCCRIHRAS